MIGRLKNGAQSFSTTIAGANASMLAIVAFALAFPTVFYSLAPGEGNPSLEYLSVSVAVVLIILYALYLLFYLSRQQEAPGPGGESNWLEGAMLCGVYLIAALTFFFTP